MVRALLGGWKTQTRRIVKLRDRSGTHSDYDDDGWPMSADEYGDWHRDPCPFGAPGDRLWVRESLRKVPIDAWVYTADLTPVRYPAEHSAAARVWAHHKDGNHCPSIHMPRWASRLTLELTAVRAERLLQISEEDAGREEGLWMRSKDDGRTWKFGIPDRDGLPGTDDDGWPWSEWDADPRQAYRKLWESINGPGSWDTNPYVWVLQFERVAA